MGDVIYTSWRDKLIGAKTEFSLENRAFNGVCVLSFLVLVYSLLFDIYIKQELMSCVIAMMTVGILVVYYYSRLKKQYKVGIIFYTFCTYAAMIINYYFNSGINGPTLLYFCLTFLLLIATTPTSLHKLWILLHLGIASTLLYIEYNSSALIKSSYQNEKDHFLDIWSGYIAIIIFVYFITNYLRNAYNAEKELSDNRLKEILAQNEQIKLKNQQLERANEEKNKLFSIVSHDMRTPIDSIVGYLNILSENLLDEAERKEIEQELYSQTKYTSDLLLNLLFWSKTQMNGVKANLYPVNLAELVDDARNFQINTASKKGIKLTYNINKGVEVIADKDMLRIVLRNVINNAIKFTRPGGEVVIKLDVKNRFGEISIKDNGIGMHDDKQKEIFTLKSDSTYGTKEEKGIGLGLMLCKEFMTYQNGDIAFESKVGQGSIFYMTLPLASIN